MIITTSSSLQRLVEQAMTHEAVALDTEFVWERTYYPGLGVVQVGFSEDECFLIDATAIRDLSPLGRLLENPAVVKILHDAQQDLAILRLVTGAFPKNIFDTRCAAGFAGLNSTISLHRLLQEVSGVTLDKSKTRSNWLKRPLTGEQIAYAIDDVRFLPGLRKTLLSRIRQHGREGWLSEELEEYDNPDLYREKDPRLQYQRVRKTGKLSSRGLAVLRELAAWREDEAREQNRPKTHIISDEILVSITKQPPHSIDELKSMNNVPDRDIRRYGEKLLETVAKGLAVSEDLCPRAPGPVSRDINIRADVALAYLKGKGIKCEIDPSLVATRSDVVSLLCRGHSAKPEEHRLLRGWRKGFVGDELMMILDGSRALRMNPQQGLPELVPAA